MVIGYLSYLRAVPLALGLSDTCQKKKTQQSQKFCSWIKFQFQDSSDAAANTG